MPAENPFWEFSLAVYGAPGVADACLRLQDDAGLDVNLVLFACWIAGAREAPLTDAEMRDVIALTRHWRERVVSPLRQIRRELKGGSEGLPPEAVESFRDEIKSIELASERREQDMLFVFAQTLGAAGTAPPTVDRAAENMARYLTATGTDAGEQVQHDCRIIAAAAARSGG